mgnify:CR=1 FL=1
MEKIYKTMQGTGVINIVIGSVIITVGLAAGVMAIVSGGVFTETQIRYYILKIGFETGQICPVEREKPYDRGRCTVFLISGSLCGELCGNGQKRIRRCAGYSLSHTWCFLYILCFFRTDSGARRMWSMPIISFYLRKSNGFIFIVI